MPKSNVLNPDSIQISMANKPQIDVPHKLDESFFSQNKVNSDSVIDLSNACISDYGASHRQTLQNQDQD